MVMEIQLDKITDYAQSVNIIIDGETTAYVVGGQRFNEICAAWNNMIFGARQMPAFGVSLDRETTKEMKSGVWAEFVFDKQLSADGMPFEKLLVNAQREWSGFNIIRYTSEFGYDGRCFYYDLVNKNMSLFYDCLTK